MSTAAEWRQMGAEELASAELAARRELLNVRCRIALSEDVKPSEVSRVRREIARIVTIQRERERAAASGAAASGGKSRT